MKKIILIFYFFLFFFFNLVFINSGISLLQPEDLTVFTDTQSVTFICNVSSPPDISNVTLYVNDSVIDYNISGINNVNYTFTQSFLEGFWNWSCSHTESGVGETLTTKRSFLIDTIGPYSSENSTNSTSAGKAIMHRLYFQDNTGLGGYIFSFDNGNGSFVNDSWVPFSGISNWSNITKAVNTTIGTTIRWKVYANDSYNKLNVSEIYSYVLIDSDFPSISLLSPEDEEFLNYTSINFTCSTSENTSLSNVSLYGNWTGSWGLNETKSITGTSNSTLFSSKVVVANKSYLWACYACDSLGNCGFSSENRTFITDTVSPVVNLVSPYDDLETTTTSQRFRFIATDNLELKNCSLYINEDLMETEISVANNTNTYFDSVTLSSSSSGRNYDWYVRCYDSAENYYDSSEWRLTIISEDDEESSSGGVSTSFWTITYSPSSSEFSGTNGYLCELAKQSRVKVVVSGSNHYVGIVALASTTAVINISSTPQQAIFSKGDEKKFDVNGNGYYDIWIKLNSITSSKANVSIKTIHEQIPSGTSNSFLLSNSTEEEEEETNPEEKKQPSTKGDKIWTIFLVIIIVCLVVFFLYLNKRRKELGYL